ncbi:MAG: PRC-barrel domain containing protein [Desulfobacteraceae bacterium]|nr:MAG: PRC-barrel domain containing protein [Desulfobacteraceae bacterium]
MAISGFMKNPKTLAKPNIYGGYAMKRFLIAFVAMAFIAFGFTPGALAAGMDKSKDTSMSSDAKDFTGHTKDYSEWIGKDVKNSQGEDLGEVKDFVLDENGEVSLVIVSHGGFLGMGDKDVAVPFSAFTFNESEDHAVLDVTNDQLASAPQIGENENLTDRAFAEEVYRHFGERPYWTEKGGAADQEMMKDKGMETREYYGDDKAIDEDFDADRDLDTRGGASLDSEMESEQGTVDNF